jgi:hypothetical protein
MDTGTNGYSGTGDWLCAPSYIPLWGVDRELCPPLLGGGKGGLWGLENYNEPRKVANFGLGERQPALPGAAEAYCDQRKESRPQGAHIGGFLDYEH